MSTQTAPTPAATSFGEDLDHYVCEVCDPEGTTALCGADVTDAEWVESDEEADCVVCVDLDQYPCQNCGAS